jgi:AcrR family transcriptional regulator
MVGRAARCQRDGVRPQGVAAMAGAAPTTATRRGDRVGRRRDILAAAASLLAERSYADFTMRDVAAGAGVSPGALYQYFTTKWEIFVELYEGRLADELGRFEALDPDIGFDALMAVVVADFAGIYAQLGRHQLLWAAEGLDPTAPSTRRLTQTFQRLASTVEAAIRDAMARAGRQPAPGAGFMPFLWATCNGAGDQLVDGRYRLHDCTRDEFLAFTAVGLGRGLTTGTPSRPRRRAG